MAKDYQSVILATLSLQKITKEDKGGGVTQINFTHNKQDYSFVLRTEDVKKPFDERVAVKIKDMLGLEVDTKRSGSAPQSGNQELNKALAQIREGAESVTVVIRKVERASTTDKIVADLRLEDADLLSEAVKTSSTLRNLRLEAAGSSQAFKDMDKILIQVFSAIAARETPLSSLTLSGVYILPPVVSFLGIWLKSNQNLKSLQLVESDSASMSSILGHIASDKSLEEFAFMRKFGSILMAFGDDICNIITTNKTLTHLDLATEYLTKEFIQQIATAMVDNSSLTHLGFDTFGAEEGCQEYLDIIQGQLDKNKRKKDSKDSDQKRAELAEEESMPAPALPDSATPAPALSQPAAATTLRDKDKEAQR